MIHKGTKQGPRNAKRPSVGKPRLGEAWFGPLPELTDEDREEIAEIREHMLQHLSSSSIDLCRGN